MIPTTLELALNATPVAMIDPHPCVLATAKLRHQTWRMWLQVILDTLELGLKIKKTPVVVGNCTGFAVNRVFFPYTMAACLLADLGADPYMVDKVIKGMFGMPMGPFRLSDLVPSHAGCFLCASFATA